MEVTRPEAESEYSRATAASRGQSGAPGSAPAGGSRTVAIAVLAGGLAGAVLLAAAEFSPLLSVHTGAQAAVVRTVQTGSHHSYALVPIALFAALLSVAAWRARNPLALLAIGVLGVAALLIALLGDLPDAQASGLIGNLATRFAVASSTPDAGFYLETLGAVVLLLSAGAGLLLGPAAPRPARRQPD
jgi:hypothetical protein